MREYVIATVKRYRRRIELTFTKESTNNCPVGLSINLSKTHRNRARKGLLKKLRSGDVLRIIGRNGDEPVQLASPDPIAKMYLEIPNVLRVGQKPKLELIYIGRSVA